MSIYTIAYEHVDVKRFLLELLERGIHEKFKFNLKFPQFKTVNVMGEHPFAKMEFAMKEGRERPRLFPAVSVTVQSNYTDSPTLGHEFEQFPVTQEKINEWRENPYLLADKSILDEIDKINNIILYGFVTRIRYAVVVTIETWSDNLNVKDFLFHINRATLISGFEEMSRKGFDNIAIDGKQDGLYNDDMGMLLYGSQIYLNGINTFEVIEIVEDRLLSQPYDKRVSKSIYYPGINNVDIITENTNIVEQ